MDAGFVGEFFSFVRSWFDVRWFSVSCACFSIVYTGCLVSKWLSCRALRGSVAQWGVVVATIVCGRSRWGCLLTVG